MRNESLLNNMVPSNQAFSNLAAVPDVILFIREFLLLKYQRCFRNTNQAIRNIFENSDDPPENDVRNCIVKQGEKALPQYYKKTLMKIQSSIADYSYRSYRINVIVYDNQHTILETVQFKKSDLTLKELLPTVSRQINSLSSSSNSNRKIHLMRMWLLAYKHPIIAIIIIANLTAIIFELLFKVRYEVSVLTGAFAALLLFLVCVYPRKNFQDASAANAIKTGRIALGQIKDDNTSVDLYIPKNAFTFFQSKNDDALAITPDTRVVEIPETPEREPGANGSEVRTNETSLLLSYQQLK